MILLIQKGKEPKQTKLNKINPSILVTERWKTDGGRIGVVLEWVERIDWMELDGN